MTNSLPQTSPQPDPALINRMLTIQEKEILLRTEELSLKKQADNNTFEYSKAALEANLKDRAAQRNQSNTNLKYTYIFTAIIVIVFFVFLGAALYFNKEQIAIEIIKAIIYIAAGGLGGYSLSKYTNNK